MENEFTNFYEGYWDCKLPVNGSSNQDFLKLGFEFATFEEGDKYRDAKLPLGWTIIESTRERWHDIIDDRKSHRASVFKYGKKPYMHLERRFTTSIEGREFDVLFSAWDNDQEIDQPAVLVFRKRMIMPQRGRFKAAYNQKMEEFRENRFCESWLDKHLPKWQDYDAYWGSGEVTFDKDKKIILVKESDISINTEKDSENT